MNASQARVLASRYSNLLELLKAFGGYYQTLKNDEGQRLSPLIGYSSPEAGQRAVGEDYLDCSVFEPFTFMSEMLARRLSGSLAGLGPIDAFCAIPRGGLALAYALSQLNDKVWLQVDATETNGSKEFSFDRHGFAIEKGMKVALIDDVTRTHGSLKKAALTVLRTGAVPVGGIVLFDRSGFAESYFRVRDDDFGSTSFPVVSLEKHPLQSWLETDPSVASDVAEGNVCWHPKSQKEQWQQFVTRAP